MRNRAFTLLEIMIALGVFAVAVTGLAVALQTGIEAALEARHRALVRIEMESRLSAALSTPPVFGVVVTEAKDNNGIRIEQTTTPFAAKNQENKELPGLWQIQITGFWKTEREVLEILRYQP